jgi:hypothetical protein
VFFVTFVAAVFVAFVAAVFVTILSTPAVHEPGELLDGGEILREEPRGIG